MFAATDALVRELVAHFASAAGVTHQISVFTDARIFERWRKRRGSMTEDEREHLDSGFALSFYRTTKPHEVYVNSPRHVSPRELMDTAAHEVTHLRWRRLPHGRTFERRVEALLAGYTCGPKSERLPEPFR